MLLKELFEEKISRKHSEETRRKMSEAHKGQIPWNKGKKMSEEYKKKIRGNENARKYSLWDTAKCHYNKTVMFQGNRDGSTPARCFATKYKWKDLPIGYNLDFTTCEIIYDLVEEYANGVD